MINYKLIENKNSNKNLVFVHGSGCNRLFLEPLAQQFKEYNCYLIDLPAHGNCTEKHIDEIKDVDDYIDAVGDFVETLDNVTLIGHSLGGTVCLGVSAKNIPSVKYSIIISSGAQFPKLNKNFMNKIYSNKVDKLYLLKCCGGYFNPLVYKQLLNLESNEVVIKDLIIDDKLDIRDRLKDINIPTLILTGGNEILTLVEYSELLKDNIKNSELEIVPNLRHMLPIIKRKYIAERIKLFIG